MPPPEGMTPTFTGRNGAVPKKHLKGRGGRRDLQIARFAKIYEEEYILHRNTVTQGEFARYMPLFNKEMLSKLSDAEKTELAYNYNQRFNPMEPVRVIDQNKLDPNGAFWLEDRQRHLVIFTLPPSRPKLRTVNELGPEAAQAAAELMASAARTAGPFDDRSKKYSAQLAALIDKANSESMVEQQKEFNKIHEELRETVTHSQGRGGSDIVKPKTSPEKADDSGLGVDWDD